MKVASLIDHQRAFALAELLRLAVAHGQLKAGRDEITCSLRWLWILAAGHQL
jgi:hypothetical protein